MPNPNQLYEDMEKLNALYEELCWDHDDELVFTHDGKEIIVYNKTLENRDKQQNISKNSLHNVASSFFMTMPRGQINKDEMKYYILKLKNKAYQHRLPHGDNGETRGLYPGEMQLVQSYLNQVFDKIDEYRYQGLTGGANRNILNKSTG